MNSQEHLLTCLAEECAEVAQRVSKALRFGLNEVQPGQPLSNAERIALELKDLLAVATLIVANGGMPNFVPSEAEVEAKFDKIGSFFPVAIEHGALV